jgi:predicted ArsR family transcriptional regulator
MDTREEPVPNDTRNDESGRFAEKYPDEAFLDALAGTGGAGTQEIADTVDCPYDTAYSKLRALAADGLVESRKIANAHLWSLSESGKEDRDA